MPLHDDLVHSAPGPRTPQDLWRYVDLFSANLPIRPLNLVERPAHHKDVVLITGTTGGFGCDALEHLLRDDTIQLVYAFNRKNSRALERQRKQFAARGLDGAFLDTPKFRMVEAVLHEPGFGIDGELLEEIRTSISHIILNAWRVNFNVSITSFEGDIQGVRNFVDLALSSPFTDAPAVMFVDSIAVFNNWKLAAPVPEIPINDPASAFGKGYSESKWVSEHLLENVTRERGSRTIVVRVGQIEGDKTGHWNVREWFPSLVKSALFQKCLPQLDGKVAWVPSYEAARVLVELRHSFHPIVHLTHPRPVPWGTVLGVLARELNVPLVPYRVWLSALERTVERGSADPAVRLLSFYKDQGERMQWAPEREAIGFVSLGMDKAMQISQSLTKLPQIDEDRVMVWLKAWRKLGFLPPQSRGSTNWRVKL